MTICGNSINNFTNNDMTPNFINNLQRKRCNYNHPDQATSQANSLILLSSGIYTEEERFVFELLQNAVDAHSDESGILDVKMVIEDGHFIFMHNGDAFTDRDIEGLCDVGNGNKMKDVKKIGYKGIGFKSVFMRSNHVVVESGGYCFKFDKSHWDNYWDIHWNQDEYGIKDSDKRYLMPWQIIPIETVAPIQIDTKDYNVVTYIKVGDSSNLENKILALLSNSQFLLFLKSKNIRMSFLVNGVTKCWIGKTETNGVVVLSANGVEESRWLIHTNKSVEVPENLRELISADINTPDKLKEAKTFDLSFAIALDKNGKLKRLEREESIIYTYLPTSFRFGSDGFPFLVNANFITDAGRQQLHKDSEWNKLIFSKIPSEFLLWIKEISSTYRNYWEVLPEKSYGRGNSLETIYAENMEKAISEIAFIPSLKNGKLLVSEAFMDRMGIAEAISADALVCHINRTYTRTFDANNQIDNVWKGSRILNSYGVFIFDKQKLKSLFEDESAFESITYEFDAKLIKFLFEYYSQNRSEQEELISVLQSTRFLLDEAGKLCVPNELFFPSSYKEQNDFAEDAKILHKEIYNYINSDKQLIDWLALLGVEYLSDITFIKKVICKSEYVTKDNAIDVGRYLFATYRKIDIFEEIGSYYLSEIRFLTKNGALSYARDLFLGSFYKPDTDIECVCDEDIFIDEQYAKNEDIAEWKLFLKKFGVNDSLSLKTVSLSETRGYTYLNDIKTKFEKKYNVSSSGNHYYYSFKNFLLHYAPFILTNNCSRSFQKLIWNSILKNEYTPQDDIIKGQAGWFGETWTFKQLKEENFIKWAFNNVQLFPSTDGKLLHKNRLFLNTIEIKEIGGKYLSIIDIDSEIHESWNDLLQLKTTINLKDCLTILTNISNDIGNAEQNKERITKVYQKLVELDALSDNNRTKIKEWASVNRILSQENEFVSPSELSHITLDGFSSKNRVYVGSPSNRDKIIDLLALMGVKIITSDSVNAEFESKKESDELKRILKHKVSALALLASSENADEALYRSNKTKLIELIDDTYFFHCKRIKLTYGDSDDVIEKHTFGSKNEFYYIGDLRPANIEPLLVPLCKYLGIKGKEREMFIMFIETIDGIKQNLADKGYNVSLIEEESVPDSGTFNITIDYHPDETAQERNLITGFKGEIVVYEKLKSMGYEPECLSISTEEDYTHEVIVNGKTYYCKPNYEKYDIRFTSHEGKEIFVEVKATTWSKHHQENMPISYRELTMVEECNNNAEKEYLIIRVFDIDKPTQDIYMFKGKLWYDYNDFSEITE